MAELHNYGLVRFSQKTGKADKIMTAIGKGMIQLWGLQNTGKGNVSLVVDIDERRVVAEFIGTDTNFPEVHKKDHEFLYELSEELLSVFDEEITKRSAR